MGKRRRSREMALQVLYQIDMSGMSPEEGLRLFYEHFDAPEAARDYAEGLVFGVMRHMADLDALIASASQNWRIERMAPVDRNILRLALEEMLHGTGVPPKVAVNEAIELAKAFGGEDSGAFVNGVLDHVLATLRKDRPPEDTLSADAS